MNLMIEKKPLSPQAAALVLQIVSKATVPVQGCAEVIAACLSLEAIAQEEHRVVAGLQTDVQRPEV